MEDLSAIDRDLMRNFDHYLRGSRDDNEPPLEASAPASQADISRVLEAVELTASSIRSMSERVRELDAHCEAFATSSEELEARNGELASQFEEMARQRDELEVSLKAENERVEQLEIITAEHISRAAKLERDFDEARADLAKVIEVVSSKLRERV